MFRRLWLALLMACLALPAMAAPLHCVSVAQASAHHGHREQDKASPPQQHDCIGCIAPFAALTAPDTATLPPVAREKPHDDLRLARAASGPDTPPPRS